MYFDSDSPQLQEIGGEYAMRNTCVFRDGEYWKELQDLNGISIGRCQDHLELEEPTAEQRGAKMMLTNVQYQISSLVCFLHLSHLGAYNTIIDA